MRRPCRKSLKTAGFAGRAVLRETRTGWSRQEMEGGPVSRVQVVGADRVVDRHFQWPSGGDERARY